MRPRISQLFFVLACGFLGSTLSACGDDASDDANGEGSGGTAGTGGSAVGGTGASTFNQCGVAAPLPAETGQCTAVTAPLIADFEDYAGAAATSYSYYVNGKPPAVGALLGGVLHVDDGSVASDGASVISTEMVTGEGDAGYALEIANTNATNWGGLMMFYFPFSGTTVACLDARAYGGVEFSIRGTSPSGRFGVTLGMLDTMPAGEHGLCDNSTSSDCKDANLEFVLPADAAEWMKVRVPWSALTPGIGSATSCVPVTGQNIVRIVIQPFMSYPPPDYMFQPGAYAITVDNIEFY
jgi:hypothetical protein